MNDSVTLGLLAIVTTCVGLLVWLVKYLLTIFKTSLDKNTDSNLLIAKSNEKIIETLQANMESSNKVAAMAGESTQFMRNLNGRLAEITAEKIQQNELVK
jgi:hypothetical protein